VTLEASRTKGAELLSEDEDALTGADKTREATICGGLVSRSYREQAHIDVGEEADGNEGAGAEGRMCKAKPRINN
jgi:hypothetical protein